VCWPDDKPLAPKPCRIPPVIRLLPVIFGILACSLAHAVAEEVNFIQITDPHIFDGKGDVDGNKEALKWAIGPDQRTPR
jgi:hypothetical protein